jgi:2,3-bisphosphoglycerate-independent phosphoglycerate mutase
VAPADLGAAECVPPHDLSDRLAVGPTGPAGPRLQALMDASRKVLADSGLAERGLAANQIWLWGQGSQPQMPSFAERYGLDAGLVTAVDLIRGLGVLTDIEVIEVEGATGHYDTNYEAKREAALDSLADGADLFIVHVEATDEAGHAGDVDEKVRALENWDRRILADLVPGLDRLGPWRMLLLPDHATPLHTKTHTADPVPYLLVDSARPGPGGTYTETGVADAPPVMGHELMGRLTGAP